MPTIAAATTTAIAPHLRRFERRLAAAIWAVRTSRAARCRSRFADGTIRQCSRPRRQTSDRPERGWSPARARPEWGFLGCLPYPGRCDPSAALDRTTKERFVRQAQDDPVALVVQKFGGTSVADPERIKAVADHIARTVRDGNEVVIVVSAMGRTTDDLIRLAGEVASPRPGRELDMLLTAGERISMALLCMALGDREVASISLTGSQAGIITDSAHGKAKIVEVKANRIRDALRAGKVAVVAGFQGVSGSHDVTTLGRGGSDTTAVALAAELGADCCEIYTDVPGVFSADPQVVPDARRISRLSFEEMLEIAASGGRVLALRSVELARNHGVPLEVRSSFTWEPGTIIDKESAEMEQAIVSAVTSDASEAKVTVTGVPDKPGIAASLFRALADRSVNVDMIVQNTSTEGATDISFTVPKDDLDESLEVAMSLAPVIGAGSVRSDSEIARVSIVGAGMKTNPGVSATMFEVLARAGINIEMISTSSIRLSCVVKESEMERAVQALHKELGLG